MPNIPAVADTFIGSPADDQGPGFRLAAAVTNLRRFLDGRIPWLWLVLLAGAGATIGIWQLANAKIEQAASARFEAVQQKTAHLIQSRLDRHVQILQGALALVAAPREPSPALWTAYIEALDVEARNPSLKGIGYVEGPSSESGVATITRFTHLGGPDLAAVLDELTSDARYHAAMDAARDSGMPTIAWAQPSGADAAQGPVDLVWLLPHHSRSASPETPEERREELRGLVFGLARVDDLPEAIVPPHDEIAIEIRAGTPPDRNDVVLYRSAELSPGSAERAHFAEDVVLHMYAQPWTIRFYSLPAFDAGIDRLSGPAILGGGGLVTLLLAALIRSLGRSRGAEARANAAQRTLEERAKDLDHLNEELEQFVYVASHDLKAPLRGIDHLAEWIEEDLGEALQGEAREHMAMLRRRVRRLETLLDDLLRYSRAGRQSPPIQWVEVDRLIRETFNLLNAEERFELGVFGDSPRFETAKPALAQVLTNLFSNAIKHHDGSTGRIEVAVRDRGALCEFVVTDDGPGIPPEHQQRIFRMFQTLQPRDRVEGSGMGLALVRKLVGRHGGTITVDSNGRSSAFRFTWKKSRSGKPWRY